MIDFSFVEMLIFICNECMIKLLFEIVEFFYVVLIVDLSKLLLVLKLG